MKINWPKETVEDKVKLFLLNAQDYFNSHQYSWANDFKCPNDVGKYLVNHPEEWENFVVGGNHIDEGYIVIAKNYDALDKWEGRR